MSAKIVLTEIHYIGMFSMIGAELSKVERRIKALNSSTSLDAKIRLGVLLAEKEKLETLRDWAAQEYVHSPSTAVSPAPHVSQLGIPEYYDPNDQIGSGAKGKAGK